MEKRGRRDLAGLTDQTLSCAARARVPKPMRRTACTHVSRAMQAARRRPDFDFTRRLGRRTEAGPRQLLRRVRPQRFLGMTCAITAVIASNAYIAPVINSAPHTHANANGKTMMILDAGHSRNVRYQKLNHRGSGA